MPCRTGLRAEFPLLTCVHAQERAAAHAAVAELRAQLRMCSDSLESKQRAASLARSAAATAESDREVAMRNAEVAEKALRDAAEAAESTSRRRWARVNGRMDMLFFMYRDSANSQEANLIVKCISPET